MVSKIKTLINLLFTMALTGYAFAQETPGSKTLPAVAEVQLFRQVIPVMGKIVNINGSAIRVQFYNRSPDTNARLAVLKQGVSYPIATLKIDDRKEKLLYNCSLALDADVSGRHGMSVGDIVVVPFLRKVESQSEER